MFEAFNHTIKVTCNAGHDAFKIKRGWTNFFKSACMFDVGRFNMVESEDETFSRQGEGTQGGEYKLQTKGNAMIFEKSIMMLCLNEEGKPVVAFGPQMNAEGRKTCKWVELQGVDFQRYINSVDGEIKMGRKTKVIPHPLMASIKATHTDAGFKHFVWNTEYILTGTLHNVELKAPEKQNVVEILDEDINKKFLHFVLQKSQTQEETNSCRHDLRTTSSILLLLLLFTI
jgi:hypothetical protein